MINRSSSRQAEKQIIPPSINRRRKAERLWAINLRNPYRNIPRRNRPKRIRFKKPNNRLRSRNSRSGRKSSRPHRIPADGITVPVLSKIDRYRLSGVRRLTSSDQNLDCRSVRVVTRTAECLPSTREVSKALSKIGDYRRQRDLNRCPT